MEKLTRYTLLPSDLLECIDEIDGNTLTINHLFWDKFCATTHHFSSNVNHNRHLMRILFRQILDITCIKGAGISNKYLWDNEEKTYYGY